MSYTEFSKNGKKLTLKSTKDVPEPAAEAPKPAAVAKKPIPAVKMPVKKEAEKKDYSTQYHKLAIQNQNKARTDYKRYDQQVVKPSGQDPNLENFDDLVSPDEDPYRRFR